MKITYRRIKRPEYQFLEEMLYEALFVAEGKPKFPRSIIHTSELKKYVENWGSDPADIAIVVNQGKELIGAIWGRKFQADDKGYGYVDSETPEISMAIKEGHRNSGIGTKLLSRIESEYQQIGVKALSLSVDKLSPAIEFYRRNGYLHFEESGTAITMLKHLK